MGKPVKLDGVLSSLRGAAQAEKNGDGEQTNPHGNSVFHREQKSGRNRATAGDRQNGFHQSDQRMAPATFPVRLADGALMRHFFSSRRRIFSTACMTVSLSVGSSISGFSGGS